MDFKDYTGPAVEVRDLSYAYPGGEPVLHGVSLAVPRGARVVVTGPNGAGKSTLLRLVGGQHSAACGPDGRPRVLVLGEDTFRNARMNRARQYLDASWGLRTVAFAGTGVAYSAEVRVGDMMRALQAEFPERARVLQAVLGVDRAWCWNALSDGQRRRVQLFVGLLVPYDVVLLDEVTALLDVLCRRDLLAFLRAESEQRRCTVLIATHVFDGLDGWPTHLCYLRAFPVPGTVGYYGPVPPAARTTPHGVYALVERWLSDERDAAARSAHGRRAEREAGPDAAASRSALAAPTNRAGGYAPGRAPPVAATLSNPRSLNMYHNN